jgi:asparagine synthase (glutamine-hydrolysing)
MAISGEPTADSSILPTYWLSRATREHVHVALSGDGGDELFGGYDRYRALKLLQRHRWWLKCFPSRMLADARPRSMRTRLRRLVAASRFADPARQYQSMVHVFSEGQIAELLPEHRALLAPADIEAAFAPAPNWPGHADPTVAARQWDLTHYLPMDPLTKVDRASMAVALEVRCPMLDTRVCQWAGRLPTNVLMPGGRPKGLLRQLAATLVPQQIVTRPKRGFAVPIGQWFIEALRRPLAEHLFNGRLDTLGIDPVSVRSYYDQHTQRRADHTHRLFALLELSLWASWVGGRRHAGTEARRQEV